MKKIISGYLDHYQGISYQGWLYILSALINSGASVAIIFLALYLAKYFHFNTISIGFIVTGYGIGAMIGALGGGVLCDHFNAHIICIFSLFINAITLLMIPFLHHYNVIMVAVVLMGISNYAFSPANRIAILDATAENNQARISGLRYMLVNLGIGAYMFADGRIATFGYELLFTLNGLIILFAGIVSYLTYLKFPAKKKATSKESAFGIETNFSFFLLLYIGLLLITLIFSQLRITYPLYLHHYYHLNEDLLSNIFLVNTVLIVILQVPIVNFLQRFNSLLTSGFGGLLIGIGLGLTFFGNSYLFAILICIAWTIGEILFFSTLQTLIYEKAEASRKGKYMGLAQMTAAFANIIGPVTGSWLYGFEHGKWLWISCLLLGIVTFLLHLKVYFEELSPQEISIQA